LVVCRAYSKPECAAQTVFPAFFSLKSGLPTANPAFPLLERAAIAPTRGNSLFISKDHMNKHVKNFAPSILSAQELVAFASRFCHIVSAHAPDDKFLNSGLEQVCGSVARLQNAMQSPRAYACTKDLAQKDGARCAALRNLIALLTAMARLDQRPVTRRSASFLIERIRPQEKRIDRIGQARRTGVILAIINALATAEALEHISTLQIKDLVAQLTNAQGAYESAYQQKIVTRANQKNAVTVREERPDTAYALSNLLGYIDAMANNCPSFAPMVAELNEAITNAMANARAGKTRGKRVLSRLTSTTRPST
jgi:Family of unknown function (DUF6261)